MKSDNNWFLLGMALTVLGLSADAAETNQVKGKIEVIVQSDQLPRVDVNDYTTNTLIMCLQITAPNGIILNAAGHLVKELNFAGIFSSKAHNFEISADIDRELSVQELTGAISRLVAAAKNHIQEGQYLQIVLHCEYFSEAAKKAALVDAWRKSNQWKIDYLQRLRNEKRNEADIVDYMKAWDLTPEEVFSNALPSPLR